MENFAAYGLIRAWDFAHGIHRNSAFTAKPKQDGSPRLCKIAHSAFAQSAVVLDDARSMRPCTATAGSAGAIDAGVNASLSGFIGRYPEPANLAQGPPESWFFQPSLRRGWG